MFFFFALCVLVILCFVLVETFRQFIAYCRRRQRQAARRAEAAESGTSPAIHINRSTPPLRLRKKEREEFMENAIMSGTILKTSEEEVMGDFGDDDQIVKMEDSCCTICLVEYEHGQEISRSASCNHVFHKPCILEWLSAHDECPCCRATFIDLEQAIHDNHADEDPCNNNETTTTPEQAATMTSRA